MATAAGGAALAAFCRMDQMDGMDGMDPGKRAFPIRPAP